MIFTRPYRLRMLRPRVRASSSIPKSAAAGPSSRARVCASDVLDDFASPVSIEEPLVGLPYITREDNDACLGYGARAADHTVVQAA